MILNYKQSRCPIAMLVIILQMPATLITVMEISIVKTVCEYFIYFILSQIIIYERIVVQPSTITNIYSYHGVAFCGDHAEKQSSDFYL